MYYFDETIGGQVVTKVHQQYKPDNKYGYTMADNCYQYLKDGEYIDSTKLPSQVTGPILIECIENKPEGMDKGNYFIIFNDGEKMVRSKMRFTSKQAAARYLPGLSLIYGFVGVFREDAPPAEFVTRKCDLNDDILI
jgi:hypothetical protein